MRADALRNAIKRAIPKRLVEEYRAWRLAIDRIRNERRSRRDVFSEIYARNQWGGVKGDFFSGPGSQESQTKAYVAVVRDFVDRYRIRSIVDLGCGDYRVGAMLAGPGIRYCGVDIVPELIEKNCARFATPTTSFLCLDIVEDSLPNADLCLLRQVLQHLSNDEIARVLDRVKQYKFVLVTEHYPAPSRLVAPNLDKPHGPDTRLLQGSGVFPEFPPFSSNVLQTILEQPVEVPLVSVGETLRTFLLGTSPLWHGPKSGPSH